MMYIPDDTITSPVEKKEFWDLFDRDGNFVRVMQRGVGFVPPDLYHVTIEVIATDFAGHLLLTRRDWSKRKGAGMWEFPAGSVLSGEIPQRAAIRELFEETGLRATRLAKIQAKRVPGMLRIAYLAYVPNLLTESITLQEGETIDYYIATIPQWYEMIRKGIFVPSRLAMYSEAFFKTIEQRVGVVQEEEKPKAEPAKRVVRRTTFGEE